MTANTILFMNLIKHRLCNRGKNAHSIPVMTFDAARQLMHLAKAHDLTAMIGSALLEGNLIDSPELTESIYESICKAACYQEIMNHELNWLRDILEDAQIPHIPLKGAAIREFYPEPWLRISGDIDILVPEDKIGTAVALLVKNGCIQTREKRYHDIPMRTPRGNILELHFNIQEDIPAMDTLLSKVWDFCEPVPGRKYEYRQTAEFLMFHIICHMAYHLINGGCGIRNFVDVELLQQQSMDSHKLNDLLAQANLTKFYEQINLLNDVWFYNKEHTSTTKLLEQLVINGGTFGTKSNKILVEQAHSGSKLAYICKRVFMPYRLLKKQYPILVKYPFLIPVFQFLRWMRIIFSNRRNVALREIQIGSDHCGADIHSTRCILQEIGLDTF